MSAVDSATPSIRPITSALTPRLVAKNRGNRLWIISDEMSINMLTKPSTQMPMGKRVFAMAGSDMCVAVGFFGRRFDRGCIGLLVQSFDDMALRVTAIAAGSQGGQVFFKPT